jgi:hypothetical protein
MSSFLTELGNKKVKATLYYDTFGTLAGIRVEVYYLDYISLESVKEAEWEISVDSCDYSQEYEESSLQFFYKSGDRKIGKKSILIFMDLFP